MLRYLREKHVVQKADGDGRLQLEVILTFMQLLLVQLAAVIQDALLVVGKSQHLHLLCGVVTYVALSRLLPRSLAFPRI